MQQALAIIINAAYLHVATDGYSVTCTYKLCMLVALIQASTFQLFFHVESFLSPHNFLMKLVGEDKYETTVLYFISD